MPSSSIKKKEEEFIQFVGVSDLEAPQRQEVEEISRQGFEKIKRIADFNQMKVHVKSYEQTPEHAKKEGKASRKKYSIHIQTIKGHKVWEADKAHDFDLVRALRKGLDDMYAILKHEFHGEVSHCKGAPSHPLE